MKIVKTLLYILLGLVALVGILGLLGKKDYHIERSIEIAAPKGMVFDYVRYFSNYNEWSPWARLDTLAVYTLSGADGEVGATHAWKGNDDVGEGRQTITAITPDRIDMEVQFLKPFESRSPVFMAFEDRDTVTRVTWAFDMHLQFPWNGFAMFTDMDAGVGKDYERGLQNLKQIMEGKAYAKYKGLRAQEVDLPQQTFAAIRQTLDIPAMDTFIRSSLPLLFAAIGKSGAEPAGPATCLYWSWDEENQKTDMAVAVPVAEAKKLGKEFQLITLEAGKAMVIDYYGVYDSIGNAHLSLDAHLADKGYTAQSPVQETYIAGPESEPDTSKWLTRVTYRIEAKKE